ncbi:MAG: hypothetical protein L6U16_11260 [Porphyromonadaceae bacterium]|nr:MAG: hypothetical protein L6U16_11260 [Porphyromonadaceae bacterium]
MRHLFYILVAMAVMCATVACGKKHSPNSVKAQVQAVDAVARLVAVDSTDTMAMQSELLKAEAMRSQFLLDGDSVADRTSTKLSAKRSFRSRHEWQKLFFQKTIKSTKKYFRLCYLLKNTENWQTMKLPPFLIQPPLMDFTNLSPTLWTWAASVCVRHWC